MTVFLALAAALLLVLAAILWQRYVTLKRATFIRTFELPRGLFDRLRERRPALTLKDCQLVARALRQFFLAYASSGCRFVSMPSQVADELWHEFILYTRNYEAFCRQAFGGFLHHTPAVVLGGDRQSNIGLRRCWWYACREENINPRNPTRLPLLFAIDAKLDIANGFRYATDCHSVRREGKGGDTTVVHCGSDFGSSSFDGTTEGFGDGGGSGGAGASGGGDGGGGDSGGCGGGGCGS